MLAAIATIAAPVVRAQDPPTVDWDSVAASLVVNLLTGDYIILPEVEKQKKLTIAVVGGNRFGRAVAAIAAGKKTSKPLAAPLEVITIADKEVLERKDEWSACQVVVFATDDAKVQTQVLAIMAGRKALLVGRRPGFVAAGGHMNLWLSDEQKPRYELDHKAVLKLGIKPSPAVVKLSKPEPKGKDD